MVKISEKLNADENSGVIVPCILRLADNDSFTHKVSAIHLMSAIYDRVGNHQETQDTLRKKFTDFVADGTPMITRAIAYHIGVLAEKMPFEAYQKEFLNIFKRLTTDDLDTVQILCIDSLIRIAGCSAKDFHRKHLVPIVMQMAHNKAWRVRVKVARAFVDISKVMETEITDNSLVNIFSTLLQDAEGDVRKEAVLNYGEFVKHVSKEKLPEILQTVRPLMGDSLAIVRSGIYIIMGYIAKHISKDQIKQGIISQLSEATRREVDTDARIE